MCCVIDLGTYTRREITLTGTDISAAAYRRGFSLNYVPATDKYYATVPSTGGSSVYVITPNSGSSWACSLLATTGGSGIPETIGIDNGAVYPYGKTVYSPLSGCLIQFLRYGHNVWALKLHEV